MEVVQELPLAFSFPTELIVKIFFLLFLFFYLLFSVLLVRQVHLMTAAIKVPLEQLFNTLSYLNLLASVLLILLSFFIL